INPAPITANPDIIRMPAQRNLGDDFQRFSVNHVERAVRFVTDVDATAIRSSGRAMVHFDAGDLSDDLIRHWIDDMYIVAGSVGLNDTDLPGSGRLCVG